MFGKILECFIFQKTFLSEPSDFLQSGLVALNTWCTAVIFEDDSSWSSSWGFPSSLFFCGGGSLPVSCIVCRFFLGLLSFNAFYLCSSFLREYAWEINFWGLIYLKTLLLYPYLELFGLLRNLKLEILFLQDFEGIALHIVFTVIFGTSVYYLFPCMWTFLFFL